MTNRGVRLLLYLRLIFWRNVPNACSVVARNFIVPSPEKSKEGNINELFISENFSFLWVWLCERLLQPGLDAGSFYACLYVPTLNSEAF
jgi:hypothetical protein